MDSEGAKADQALADQAAANGIDPETGFATDGEWPVNHRMRAEAMSKAGVTTDPAGAISDELIADAGERLKGDEVEAKRVADEEADATPSLRWDRDRLVAEAERIGAAIETDANKPAILKAINAAQAATTTEG